MKISREVRDAAAAQNDVHASTAEEGRAAISERFRESDGEIYVVSIESYDDE